MADIHGRRDPVEGVLAIVLSLLGVWVLPVFADILPRLLIGGVALVLIVMALWGMRELCLWVLEK